MAALGVKCTLRHQVGQCITLPSPLPKYKLKKLCFFKEKDLGSNWSGQGFIVTAEILVAGALGSFGPIIPT
jgi:hypothetical protein